MWDKLLVTDPCLRAKVISRRAFLAMFHVEMLNRESQMIPEQELKKLGNCGLKERAEPCQEEW
jgi:hypothetical protein